MSCEAVTFPGGTAAIVCSRGRRRVPQCSVRGCRSASRYQCDAPVGSEHNSVRGRKPAVISGQGTCDRHLCEAHRISRGRGVDLCPDHAAPAQLELSLWLGDAAE